MEPIEIKRLIEEALDYNEVKRLLVKLVQIPSPQTDLLEEEPQILSLIRDVVKPELEESGIQPVIDGIGNLISFHKGKEKGRRLSLMAYALNAAHSTMQKPYSGAVLDG
ncbi:MAG: hypothetical protein IH857_08345, partial [Deltaproteobacteria bacterium]|nr:hypothetical protein [Deltaproteobacteria bacterium]